MNYTIVAYKPDGEDICMGCHMGGWSSDFKLIVSTNRAAIIESLAGILSLNDRKDEGPEYDTQVLIDGLDYDNDEERRSIEMEAAERAKVLTAEREDRQKRVAEEMKQRVMAEQRANDLRQLARLKEQYEK